MSLLYNNMLTNSDLTFHNLLKTYSICPPSDPGFAADTKVQHTVGASKIDRPSLSTGTGSADPRLSGSATTSIEMRKVSKDSARVYIDLNPYALQTAPGAAKGHEGGNTLYFNVSQAAIANWAPVWFLPWRTGAAVRVTIPPIGAAPNPDIFFTAAINGCSVFVQGNANNPTITHCGGNTGFAEHQLNEGATFWEAVMDAFIASDTAAGKNKGVLHGTTVDKRDYVAEPGYSKNTSKGLIKSTGRAQAYQQELKNQIAKTGRVRIQEVSPWGCVLGRRDAAGNWKFFLQENATIAYYEITSKNPFKAIQGKNKSVVARVSVPMSYREIFPGGQQHASIHPTLPKIV